ncbi:CHAT domain-containing protein [Anabaena cylindrica FACHB-243]|uniref:Tetratricopeptide TPR_2 repeat-containing protein n=1 Tax=Anabaena cylindrica (strain ATCC 27899 / PCC 7122) TaxID=272123 RepID=K9ZQJ0_ANACC|nr:MULTISPECIES: tetratricopeptide repeat protein [Anabaena]AFZ61059.1 Tetratricopeptide TPR_2 repeat-containing protein [Anabaena cylindrica PCC 7122]MBD2421812.1 CHAT domain-containing protein [Anabaena cylindrica FACHB-243]MBY5283050.1 CHAT domain-containing protein [Anabaena sp. CCAP 1446/1C]MBY5310569.1 CHAT domain-containing protein [Anabaena sp. CCAP 1446/1C]MCM2408069.1 CHAT domain-containing protein [Anabaena sp. CCAP 1446/1C]
MEQIINQLIQLNLKVVELAGQGNLKHAMTVAQQAVNIGVNQQLTENSAYCDSLNNLAELHRIQGHYLEAKPLYLQALNIRKKLFGDEHPDVAQSLNNLAALYHAQGNYPAAAELFLEALELWKVCFGEEDFEVATTLNNLAEIYREQGQYLKAEQVHLEALTMRRSLFGDEHPDIAQSLTNLAALYTSTGRYSNAEEMHLEALAMKTRLFGEGHLDIASSLNNLGKVYDAQGRYLEAKSKFLEALEICQKNLGEEHPYIAFILSNIAGIYQEQGSYLDAEKKYLEVLSMRKRLLSEEHPDIANSLDHLGEVYLIQGNYLVAEQKYLEAYDLRKRLFSWEHPDIAESLSNLAVVFTYQGRYMEAKEQYSQALPMLEKLLGKKHLSIAHLLNNMAGLDEAQGDYSEAEQKYLKALEIQKNILGNEHPVIADTLNQIAALYRIQGRYSESEQLHLEGLAMRKRLLGEHHPFIATNLNNLAVLYDDLHQYDQSESLLIEALEIVKNVFGNEHPHVASSMNNLAVIYDFQGRYQEAEKLHLETLKLRILLLGEEHIQIANSLNNLGELYFSLGRYQEAEQKYVETLAMRKRLLGEEHPDVAFSLNNLATLLAATNRPDESLLCRIQGSKINNKMIRNIFAFSSESDRLAFLKKIRNDFDLFLSLVNKHLFNLDSAKLAAFDFVLQRKALTASALASQNAALYSGRYPQLQVQLHHLRDLNTQLIHLTFSVPQAGATGVNELPNYRENLAQLQVQYNYLQKQLALQVPEIQLSESNFDRQAIAKALPIDSILVEFVRFNVFDFPAIQAQGETQWHPPRYLAFVFRSGQPDTIQMVDLGAAETIDQLIQVFRLQASDYTEPTLAWSKNSQTPKLQIKPYNSTPAIKLSQALFHPIRDLVKDCRHLIIAPDSNLNLVPFQILPFGTTGSRLLMDEYIISYLSVGREILRSQVKPPTGSISAPLIIADPDFDLTADLTVDATTDRNTSNILRQPIPELLTTFITKGLSRAPGTRFLGESVAKKLPDAKLYLGAEALETRLTSSECPNIMLIATHGLFQSNSESQPVTKKGNLLSMEHLRKIKVENPMLRSGLALAGANTWLSGGKLPKDAGKGFLFAQDIASLDLWANELTVLSACDTARGDIQIGEGVFGLRRAFAVAGSKTLVMSLWPVPDKATALLMERFFDNLQSGMDRAEALHSAQNYIRNITVKELRKSALGLEVLKTLLDVRELTVDSKISCQEYDTPLKHPFYWGAWICQGETDRLVI